MVKFKMKLILILCATAFMTLTMFFYSTSFANFLTIHSFFRKQSRLDYDEPDTSVVKDNNEMFLRLVRNPISSLGEFDAKFAGDNLLVAKDLKIVRNKKGKYLTSGIDDREGQGVYFNYSRSSVTQYEKPISSINVVKNVDLAPEEVITIRGGTVKMRSISQLFENKSDLQYFQSRRNLMLSECSKHFNASSLLQLQRSKLEHILVDQKNKMLFCYIPKVACTNWRRMLLLLTGQSSNISHVINMPSYEIHAKNMLASLQNFSTIDINYFVKNYAKIIFVRNPLERILSAYRNKFEQHYNSSKYFQSRFGKYIVKKFRANPSNDSLYKGDDVTFEEFVKYVIASPKEQYNEHWQTMNDLCNPCFFKYDVIGKYETLLNDSKSVLQIYNIHEQFPSLAKPSRTASSIAQYYKKLSPELIGRLYKIYEMDFRLFGYDVDDTLGFLAV